MANEITSTTTTLAGVMERLQADATAAMPRKITLYEAVLTQPSDNAQVVQFPSFAAPAPVSSQTEANAVAGSAVSISAKTATLKTFVKESPVSKLALQGGNTVIEGIAFSLLGDIAASIDKEICSVITSFTPLVSGTQCSPGVFTQAVRTLNNIGYVGDNRAILSYGQFSELVSGLTTTRWAPATNDDMIQNGPRYKGKVDDVKIYVVPSGLLPVTSETTPYTYGVVFCHPFGIGLGHYEPIITFTETPYDTANVRLGAIAYCDAVELSAVGGVRIFTPMGA